ncbi:hypothetical protein SPRG_15696 [Saprolegnia parasitica CBS 223.65]|uniref:Uncharacterized protein n=1 Tax=Saprolegnia parasitica (strain CBS 223.65) TaxID=695850 RepID=A0A067BKZ8_SAPPC|nr:hypothetical protein SPRG_15696 [Saprolegnia parasitica CBS 223.65]KDO18868.1 hypothetical protein SPRG_15696 [Saprolegnia parasitica CBS 223.65]|eukprot:XP_012210422.1 hypothetical protein SPRG_15696 [Saprolegnia parasitica CBS 223.65]
MDVPPAEDKVLCDLDPRYFTPHFDAVAHVLESLPLQADEVSDFLQSQIGVLDLAKDVVTAKLAEDVQRNHTTFIQGMNQVQDVDLDLTLALIQVKNGRRLLASAKQDLVINHLELVKLRRNRDRLRTIVDHSSTILGFVRLEHDMLSHLQEKDYASAVAACIDIRRQLDQSRELDRFFILRPVRQRMAHALVELRQHFETALVGLLESFDAAAYGNLLRAMMALDAERSGPSTVPQVLVRGVDDLSRQHIQRLYTDATVIKKTKPTQSVVSMLQDLLACYEKLVGLLHGYYLITQWHRTPFSDKNVDAAFLHRCGFDAPVEGTNQAHTTTDEMAAQHAAAYQQYRRIVWEQMQQSVGDLLDRFPLTNDFKMEHLVSLAHATLRLIMTGHEFSGDDASTTLTTALSNKCRSYLKLLQKDSIELLRMLFDTEKWERLSVAIDNHSGGIPALLEQRSGYSLPDLKVAQRLLEPRSSDSVFMHYRARGNPFALCYREKYLVVPAMQRYAFENRRNDLEADPLADEEDKMIKRMIALDPYLRGESDSSVSSPQTEELIRFGSKHVMSSSSLSGFLRFCGVYMKLMEQLPHVAWDIFLGLASLFDFVFYATLTTACPDNYLARLLTRQTPSDLQCEELRQQLSRIQSELGLGLTAQSVPVRVTQLPPAIAASSDANRFAFVERVVAIEALVFQWHVFSSLHAASLAPFVPAARQEMMATMMTTMGDAVREGRSYVYAVMAPALIAAASIPSMVEKATWDTLDLSDQHNEYVVALVRRISTWIFYYVGTLQGSAVPIHVRDEIWSYVVRAIMEALVEGYASVKKCSMEGRALMSMDLIALQNGLDLINHVSNQNQTLWGRSYVNNYIKAYYLQEAELLAFIAANKKSYRKAHLVSLAINGVCGLRRGTQKDLLQKIEHIYRSGTT